MKYVALSKLVDLLPCSYGKNENELEINLPVAKVATISKNGYFKNKYDTRSFKKKDVEKLTLKKGELLVVKSSGSKANILSGKTAYVSDNETGMIASNFLFRLKPIKSKIAPKYLWYALNSSIAKKFIRKIVGATTYPNLKWSTYKDFLIPLPSLKEQNHIIKTLDSADMLRQKRQQTIELTEQLLQSIFIDMFGDPISNPKKWDLKKLGDILYKIEGGYSPKCLAQKRNNENEKAILKLSAVTSCLYNEAEHKLLSKTKTIKKPVEVTTGDLLFTRKNTQELVCASAYVFKTSRNLFLPDTIFKLNYQKNLTNGIFLWKLLTENHFRKKLQKLASGSAGSMPNISMSKLKSVVAPLPPIDMQNKFAEIVQKTEYLKQKMLEQSKELNSQFQALLQKAFTDGI